MFGPFSRLALLGVSLVAAPIARAAEPIAHASDPIVNLPAAKLDWKSTPEGVAFAALEGDRFAEPYMAMVRLPAGLISPPHVKSANMFGVIVSGRMIHSATGESDETILDAGSFYKIPKQVPHVSKCISKVDCVTFLYQDGRFDFVPVSSSEAKPQ